MINLNRIIVLNIVEKLYDHGIEDFDHFHCILHFNFEKEFHELSDVVK